MAGSWLESFKGQRITVITLTGNEERTDTGAVVEMGDGWVQLAKENGEMLLIPSTAIRIIKLLDQATTITGMERGRLPSLDTHIYEPNAQTL